MAEHYQILENSSRCFCIKIDPRAFMPHLIREEANGPPDTFFGVNTNYFYKPPLLPRYVINQAHDSDTKKIHYYSKYDVNRPKLKITKDGHAEIFYGPTSLDDCVICQAGPTLLYDNVLNLKQRIIAESFKEDAVRKYTAHTSVGITAYGKLIFVYSYGMSASEIAYYYFQTIHREYKERVVSAMKFDGGHSSWMYVKGIFEKGNKGIKPIGLVLTR